MLLLGLQPAQLWMGRPQLKTATAFPGARERLPKANVHRAVKDWEVGEGGFQQVPQ